VARTVTVPIPALVVLLAACQEQPPSPPLAPLPEVRLEATVEGVLEDRDTIVDGSREDRWVLDLAAGQRAHLELRADSFDAELRVLGPGGLPAASNNDALGRDAALILHAAAGGHYTVAVRTAGADTARGSYRLTVRGVRDSVAAPGVIGTLAVGDSISGVLEAGDSVTAANRGYGRRHLGLVDYYRFTADGDGWVSVELRSPQFDAYLAVGGFDGGWRGQHDDDGAGGTDARIVQEVVANEPYMVAAASFGGDRVPGLYSLAIRRLPPPRAGPDDSGELGRREVIPLALVPGEARVCAGKPLGTAVPYDRARRQFHPMRVVASSIRPTHDREGLITDDLSLDDVSQVELVLCMERRQTVVQVCRYIGPSITRYRYRWSARLLEARTARVLVDASVLGGLPRPCGYSEPYSLTAIHGSHEDARAALADIRPRLARWIRHAAADSALPAPPPHSTSRAGGRRDESGQREPGTKPK
jgi:hypothetical protein